MANEDFSGYTEADPNSKITVTSSKIDLAGLSSGDTAYVTKDFTSNFFNGDWEINFEICVPLSQYSTVPYSFFSNRATSTWWQHYQNSAVYQSVAAEFLYNNSVTKVRLQEHNGTSEATTALTLGNFSNNTLFYLTFKRVESVGTYGTLYCYVYTDAARTTQKAGSPLSLAIRTATRDFQYYYPLTNFGMDANPITSYTQNHEFISPITVAVGHPAMARWGGVPYMAVNKGVW